MSDDQLILFPGWGGFKLELLEQLLDDVLVAHSDMWQHVGPFSSHSRTREGTYRLRISHNENFEYSVTNNGEPVPDSAYKGKICTVQNPGKLTIRLDPATSQHTMWTADYSGTSNDNYLIGWETGMSRQMFAELPGGELYRLAITDRVMHLTSKAGSKATVHVHPDEAALSLTTAESNTEESRKYLALYADYEDDDAHRAKLVYASAEGGEPTADRFIFHHYNLHNRGVYEVLITLAIIFSFVFFGCLAFGKKGYAFVCFILWVVFVVVATLVGEIDNNKPDILHWDGHIV